LREFMKNDSSATEVEVEEPYEEDSEQ